MTKRPNIWIVPHRDGWAVKREGADRATKVERRKQDAEDFGRSMAQRDRVEFIVQRRDGTIQSKDSFGRDPFPPRDTEH